jgi:dihydrodipicolinate reductase
LRQECSKLFDSGEIIEYHHDKKLDAPSGTAFKTALLMREARGSDFERIGGDEESDGSTAPHSRGGTIGGIPIHSVRLAGYLAHQEVIFGMAGQTLLDSPRHHHARVLHAGRAARRESRAWLEGLDLRTGEDSVSKKKVAVIGATGIAGQQFLAALPNHP